MIHKGTPWRPQKASQVTSSRATRHCLAYSSTIKDGKAKPRRKKNTIITGIIIIIRSHDYNQHSHHQPTHPPSYRIIPNTPHLSLAQTSIITKKPESESTASTTPAFLADTPNSKAQHPVNLTYLAPARPLNTRRNSGQGGGHTCSQTGLQASTRRTLRLFRNSRIGWGEEA
ncbi:hypothetical protein ACSS6W_010131 [Trichoderma asperelloides]